jgi:amino acid adenylation domain-containing protein
VLKLGSAYVPVDPSMPGERQAFMIRDCGARHVLAEGGITAGLELEAMLWIDYAEMVPAIRKCPADNLSLRMASTLPAYAMYTSGSTGTPKGVIVPHRAVNRLVINNGYAQIEPSDCIAHCSNPAFDASTFEIWAALLNGASVLIVSEAVVLEGERFAKVLRNHGVSVLFQTTALFNRHAAASPQVFAGLRYLLFGGEVSDPNAVRKVLRDGHARHLLHMYGPTEATTFATWYSLVSMTADATSVPIGRPISNTQVYILDALLESVPIGVTGEIYIGGPGLARGYLNRAELTAERFLPDPFSADPKARIYKTGDLGRWRADGNVDFVGRNDHQVKIRGFRIELGEIETQLLKHEQIEAAVVIAREDVPGEKRLVAYVIVKDPSSMKGVPSVETLRTHLKAVLPDYMVPSAFVTLQNLPLTPNGKLDRRALPAPELEAYARRHYEAPEGPVEEILAQIWQTLLRVERIGRQDNFFELGGHSLLATRAASRIREVLQVELPLRALFDEPTLTRLSIRVAAERRALSTQETQMMDELSQEIRRDIGEMSDEEVLAEIAELKKELGSVRSGGSAPL